MTRIKFKRIVAFKLQLYK